MDSEIPYGYIFHSCYKLGLLMAYKFWFDYLIYNIIIFTRPETGFGCKALFVYQLSAGFLF